MDNNNPIVVCFYRVNLYKDSGHCLLTFVTRITGMTHNPLTSTVLRVPADSDVIDCALPRCTLSFSKTIHLMVLEAGLEPARLTAGDFKSPVATNYTTRAFVSLCYYYIAFFSVCQDFFKKYFGRGCGNRTHSPEFKAQYLLQSIYPQQ